MIPITEIFRSVGDIWLVWFAAVLFLAGTLGAQVQRIDGRRIKRFFADEGGASYALPYLLTFPVYLMVVALIIQATLILFVKMGTVYAAYSASRSAIVWRNAEVKGENVPDGSALAQRKAKQAAVNALAPFASSNANHRTGMFFVLPGDLPGAIQYELTYRRLANGNVSSDKAVISPFVGKPKSIAPSSYVRNKYRFASLATSVKLEPPDPDWNAPFKTTVTYEMPMVIPGAGRILGTWWKSFRFYSRNIVSTIEMPSETPQSANHRIGIPYKSDY